MTHLTDSEMVALAKANAPVLRFDNSEPFMPTAMGYTVHTHDGPSASAEHMVQLGSAGCAIEYSIWWDWDIQHLYELEHVWVYLDAHNNVCRVDASSHGTAGDISNGGTLPIENGRVTLFSEPGKHAFSATADRLRSNYYITTGACGARAGAGGILVKESLKEKLADLSVYDDHLAKKYLQSQSFAPSFQFDLSFDLRDVELLPWPALLETIPDRLRMEMKRLRAEEKGVKAVLLDSGDTLIDESTQVYIEGGIVLQADPLPGGERLVQELKNRGYLVALVADGLVESFDNVHRALGFYHLFDAKSISEDVGVEKPHRAMFDTAVAALGLTEDDHAGCIMVGNNLARDIAGANALGMTSVWLNWTKRYPVVPETDLETPDYTIRLPHQLLDVLEKIDGA